MFKVRNSITTTKMPQQRKIAQHTIMTPIMSKIESEFYLVLYQRIAWYGGNVISRGKYSIN